ncbi:hypothetical protein [Streptomyces lunaelactis]|uniref:hypothetical protein n=1 Tax=Streptomyces lunaelactis TaxID=1535768 RepID=UPI0020C7CEA5|nr:hypothetical protein [Streptomyces lunaelactis]
MRRIPAFDRHPARDDFPLRAVVEDAAMGRWEGARDLLARTGTDWDRRIFRLQVLARAGVRLTFADTWAQAEPRSAHALALLATVQALRSMASPRGMGSNLEMEHAWESCNAACNALPSDPAPYVVMLALLRYHSPARDRQWRATVRKVWEQVEERDRWNREAHHELLTYMFPTWHGIAGEMFHWAQERCAHAPRGLPIHTLPLAALAESHRLRMEKEGHRYGLTVHPWTDNPSTQQTWENWWTYRAPVTPHAAFHEDANYLAHALSFANQHRQAAEVFDAIGPYAADVPWSYCGDAPMLFTRHRTWAVKASAP